MVLRASPADARRQPPVPAGRSASMLPHRAYRGPIGRRVPRPAFRCSPSSSPRCASRSPRGLKRCASRPASGCSARATRATRCTSCAPVASQVVDEATGAVIRELGRGDALGELALLTVSPRSASVRAARASDLLAIERSDFEELLRASPALSLSLNRVLAEQLRDIAPRRRPHGRCRRPSRSWRSTSASRSPSSHAGSRPRCSAISPARARRQRKPRQPAPGEPASVYAPVLDRAEADHDLVLLAAGRSSPATPGRSSACSRPTGSSPSPPAARVPTRCAPAPSCAAAIWSPTTSRLAPARCRAGPPCCDPLEAHCAERRARRRPRADGPAAERPLGRDRPLGRRRARVRPHRRARGADRRRRDDRPRRRRQHGRVRRSAVRDGPRRRRDRRTLLRGVGPAPPAGRLHAPPPRADPRRARRGDAAADLRRDRDRGAAAQLHVRLRRAAQRAPGDRALGPAWESVGFSICLPILAPPQVRGPRSVHRRLACRQPARSGDGRSRRGPDHRRRREGHVRAPARTGARGAGNARTGSRAWERRSPGCCCSAAPTPPRQRAATPTW